MKYLLIRAFLLFHILVIGFPSLASSQAWQYVAPMNFGRAEHKALVMKDGRVIVTGGVDQSGSLVLSCEIYDPKTNNWSSGGSLNQGRRRHELVLLNDGRIVAISGMVNDGGATTVSNEIFDPATLQWSYLKPLAQGRSTFTHAVLPDQRIMILGGLGNGTLKGCELLDPVANTVQTMPDMIHQVWAANAFYSHAAGGVIIRGGSQNGAPGPYLRYTQFFNIKTSTWTLLQDALDAQSTPDRGAVMLPDERILVPSGRNGQSSTTRLVEAFDPFTKKWKALGMLARDHDVAQAVLVGRDSVIVVGGDSDPPNYQIVTPQCSWFNLRTSTSVLAPTMNIERFRHQVVTVSVKDLPTCVHEEAIMVIGGKTNSQVLSSCEILNVGNKPNRSRLNVFPEDLEITLNDCGDADTLLYIAYRGCEDGVVTKIELSEVDDPPAITTESLPYTLPDEGGAVRIHVSSWDGNSSTVTLKITIMTSWGEEIRYVTVTRGSGGTSRSALGIIPPSLRSIQSCDSTRSDLVLKNGECYTRIITSYEIIDNPELFTVASNVPLPKTLGPGEESKATVLFNPKDQAGSFGTRVRIKGILKTSQGDVPFDSIVSITAVSRADGKIELESTSLKPVGSCDSTSTTVLIKNSTCYEYVITSFDLAGINYSLENSIDLPMTIPSGEERSITIDVDPYGKPGKLVGNVHVIGTYINRQGPVTIDTLIPFVTTSDPTPAKMEISAYSIDFNPISTCKDADTLLTLRNTGCDTLTITAAELVEAGFGLGDLVLPVRLAPGESVALSVTFSPDKLAKQFATLKLTTVHQGLQKIVEIPLSGVGLDPEMAVAMSTGSVILLPAITKCQTSDTLFVIQNKGCDTLKLEITQLSGAPVITVQGGNYLLPPDSLASTSLSIVPVAEGSVDADILIRILDKNGKVLVDSIIHVTNTILPGSKVLTTSATVLDLGEMSLCDTRSKDFTVKNNGCDTLIITSLDLDSRFTSDASPPIKLAPGESRTITITLSGDALTTEKLVLGSVHVGSTADNQLADILVNAQITEPRNVTVAIASAKPKGSNLDVVSYDVSALGGLTDVNTIEFDLTYNSDILAEMKLTNGVIVATKDAMPMRTVTIRLDAPFANEDQIEAIQFIVRVAQELNTPIAISNVKLNGGDADFTKCVATIAATGSSFDYINDCGDNYLRDSWLRMQAESIGGVMRIGDDLLIEHSARGAVTFELYDMLGRLASSARADGIAVRMNIAGVSEGAYVLRMVTPGTVKSKVIKIQR
jgi:hypothetical protein